MVKIQNTENNQKKLAISPDTKESFQKVYQRNGWIKSDKLLQTHALIWETEEHSQLKILAHPCELQVATAQDLHKPKP